MKKITWLDINSSYSHTSSALAIIHAQEKMQKIKYEWNTAKGTTKSEIKNIIWEIIEQKPDIIAFTAYLFTCDFIYQILSRIKVLLPNTIIIGGGPEYLGDNQAFLEQHRYINFVIRGEGENSFYQLLGLIFSNAEPIDEYIIKGVCHINNDNKYIDNGLARVEHFNSLILPENSVFFNWDKPFVQLETARGCFNSCTFCVSGNDKPIRVQPIALVEKRIENIHKKGIKDIRVLDRTFNSNPKRAIEMLNIFSEYPNMNFHLELHPALLTKEVNEAIAALPKGLLHIEAGIQSLDDKVLEASGRKGEKILALKGLNFLCSLNNIKTHADLIAGLPFYTLEQVYKDVYSLAKIGSTEIQLENLKLLPGTQMRNKAKDLGIYFSPTPPYEVLKTNWIDINKLQEATILSKILDIYYNKPTWHIFFRNLLLKYNNIAEELTNYFRRKDYYSQPLSQEKQGLIMYNFIEEKYADSLVDFKIEWLKNGLTIKKLPSANLNKVAVSIEDNISIIFGEPIKDMRLYAFEDNNKIHIFGFNRDKNQAKPIFYGVKDKR